MADLQRIQDELVKQMAQRGLRFNIESKAELREVLEETSEYINEDYYGRSPDVMVSRYLDETMESYPEHIEPIREYIEPIPQAAYV